MRPTEIVYWCTNQQGVLQPRKSRYHPFSTYPTSLTTSSWYSQGPTVKSSSETYLRLCKPLMFTPQSNCLYFQPNFWEQLVLFTVNFAGEVKNNSSSHTPRRRCPLPYHHAIQYCPHALPSFRAAHYPPPPSLDAAQNPGRWTPLAIGLVRPSWVWRHYLWLDFVGGGG